VTEAVRPAIDGPTAVIGGPEFGWKSAMRKSTDVGIAGDRSLAVPIPVVLLTSKYRRFTSGTKLRQMLVSPAGFEPATY